MNGGPIMEPIKPHERYIAIGGESWSAALGQDQSKYITPKVGIFLYGPDSRPMREQVEGMAFMSANADMALFPLIQIMQVIQERFIGFSKRSGKYKEAAGQLQVAIDAVRAADRLTNKTP
jgi:hypothetical protein